MVRLVVRGDEAHRRARLPRRARLELLHHAAHMLVDVALARGLERAFAPVELRQRERRHHHLVERGGDAVGRRVLLDHVLRLLVVEREEPLVEALLRREHRVDAEEHVEIPELR